MVNSNDWMTASRTIRRHARWPWGRLDEVADEEDSALEVLVARVVDARTTDCQSAEHYATMDVHYGF